MVALDSRLYDTRIANIDEAGIKRLAGKDGDRDGFASPIPGAANRLRQGFGGQEATPYILNGMRRTRTEVASHR